MEDFDAGAAGQTDLSGSPFKPSALREVQDLEMTVASGTGNHLIASAFFSSSIFSGLNPRI